MKKRFLAAFMILVMGCALTACDEEEAADGQTADTASEAEEGSCRSTGISAEVIWNLVVDLPPMI